MVNANRLLLLMFIFLGFHFSSSAQDDTSRIKKLSRGADIILTGKVTKKNSSWNANKTKIYTRTTLQVDEYLKGKNNGNTVEITSPGGEVGDVGELYTHMPTFEEKEEVLVFLKRDDKSQSYQVFSGEEGKITVIDDEKTKEKTTRSNQSIKALKSQIKSYVNEQ